MSDVSALFGVARLKVARGKRHIFELEQTIAAFVASAPMVWGDYELKIRDDGLIDVRVTFEKFETALDAVAPIIGDAIHNLRAALDLMSCELSKTTSGPTFKAQFPFAKSELGLTENIKSKSFNKCGNDAVALLRKLRPFAGGNLFLNMLHEMDIMDKHVSLHPTATSYVISGLAFDPSVPTGRINRPADEIKFIFPREIGNEVAGREVIPTLHLLAETVESILEAFSTLVAARH